MEPVHRSTRPADGRRASGQSYWALLPALALVAAILWIGGPALRRQMRSPVPAANTEEDELRPELLHVGFEAEVERGGAPLRIRLAPLHAAPVRQAFDGRALGRLLELGKGMPWRLELSRGVAGQGAPLGLPLDLAVADADGAFRALPLERLAPESPLAPLLRPRGGTLGAGQAESVILWGPETARSPRLVGLGEDLELAAASWEARGEDEALMHLEPLR